MLRKIFAILFPLFFIQYGVYSQDLKALDFLSKYNEQIDPLKKLDTINYLSKDSKLSAKTNLSPTGEYKSENQCYYSVDGGVYEAIIDKKTGFNKASTGMISLNPLYKNKYLIRNELEYYRIDSIVSRFSLLEQNDSITVISEQRDEDTYHIITFETNSYSLLQTKRTTIHKDEIDESTTDYLEFQVINDIKVPTKVRYSGKYAEATLTYSNYSFEPFDKSVFKE